MRLDHVGIVVDDLEQAKHFLAEILGLEMTNEVAIESAKLRAAYFRCGEVEIELLELGDSAARQARLGTRRQGEYRAHRGRGRRARLGAGHDQPTWRRDHASTTDSRRLGRLDGSGDVQWDSISDYREGGGRCELADHQVDLFQRNAPSVPS